MSRGLGAVIRAGSLWLAVFALGEPLAGAAEKSAEFIPASPERKRVSNSELTFQFNIPAQSLEHALLEFSRQSKLALLMPALSELTLYSRALKAKMTRFEALSFLLAGSGLRFKEVTGQGLVILPVEHRFPRGTVQSKEPLPVSKPLLEEVVVTASKRATNLQDTPMAVTAISQLALNNYHVNSVFDLATLVPNLQLARNGDHSASVLYIRGIGSDNYTEAGDPGIASHVDGIYSSRSQGSAILLYDLERIEVLRGPQGTLFGRNSTGGVINYHSNKPTQSLESDLSLTLGDYKRRAFKGMVNVPLSDTWALRLAAANERSEGFVDFAPGSITHKSVARYNNLSALRLSSDWQATDALQWLLSYEEFRDQSVGFVPLSDYETPLLIDTLGRVDLVMRTYRSRVNWSLNDGVELSYISGFSHMTRNQDWDGDQSSAPGSEINPAEYHQSNRTVWSNHSSRQHELQLKSTGEARLQWLVAYFNFEENNGIRFDLEHQNTDGSGWGGAPAHSFQQPSRGSEFEALYGQLSFDLNKRWGLSAGMRTGRDLRYDRGGRNIACPDLIVADRNGELGLIAVNRESAAAGQCYVVNYNDVAQRWSSSTYMGRLEYRPGDGTLLYLLFAEGFKPGIVEDGTAIEGFFTGVGDPAFQEALVDAIAVNNGEHEQSRAYVEPEHSKNFELGFKLSLLNGGLTFNGALFNTRYSDLQVSGVAIESDGSEIFRSTNAAAASIKGLELEVNWALASGGRFSGNVSLLDATYDHFLAVDRDFPRYGQTWNPSAGNEVIPDLVDYSGNKLKQAPKVSLSIVYSHAFNLRDGGLLTPQLRFSYSEKVFFDEANREGRSGELLNNRTGLWEPDPNGAAQGIDFQPAYGLWAASLKYEPRSGQWSLVASVDNISDELVRSDAHSPEAQSPAFYVGPPRTVSVRLSTRFE